MHVLQHLETIGSDTALRFLGIDEQGREIPTFVEGAVELFNSVVGLVLLITNPISRFVLETSLF